MHRTILNVARCIVFASGLIVITTQHIKNVETLDSKQNEQLQTQLEREDPELKRAIEERNEVGKRKETSQEQSQPAETTTAAKVGESTKTSQRKHSIKKSKKPSKKVNGTSTEEGTARAEGADNEEELPQEEEEPSRTRPLSSRPNNYHLPLRIESFRG
ncbi:hypothetical protein PHMEG_00024763 [Phytophthora megakarya]|uniref:Uncharacterized protein n=1 Tax=Phytophthora megakarya TaxID=4795 RepID=A0A225VG79_9STRA|nr:hypothetical protein PHMEG_00024763 [Phytophthora megakarya]